MSFVLLLVPFRQLQGLHFTVHHCVYFRILSNLLVFFFFFNRLCNPCWFWPDQLGRFLQSAVANSTSNPNLEDQ